MTAPTPLPPTPRRVSAKAARKAAATDQVVAYLRVSTAEQAVSGLGLEAQRVAIEAAATARGWTVARWCTDAGVSGSVVPAKRPGMACALEALADGSASTLLVAKLDRCSRSSRDFTALLEQADQEGWDFVALDLGVDTSTPAGRMIAEMMVAVAQWERSLIAERTSAALQVKKAAGARLGAPIRLDEDTRQRVRSLRHQGISMQAIADQLNSEGVVTATGKAWTWHNVRRVVESLKLDDQAATNLLV